MLSSKSSTAATTCSRLCRVPKPFVNASPCRSVVAAPSAVESCKLSKEAACPCSSRVSVIANAAKGFGAPKKQTAALDPTLPCPCGSGKTHEACCKQYLDKKAKAGTPEALLRSRYTAYALQNPEYIADTTHVESQEYTGSRSTYISCVRSTQRRADYKSLEIIKQEPGTTPTEAFITFKCSFVLRDDKTGKMQQRLEKSHFVQDKTGWMYMGSAIDDEIAAADAPAQQQQAKGLPTFPGFQLPSIKL